MEPSNLNNPQDNNSNDPKFENELLKLQLKAETGHTAEIGGDAPLEIQNEFLNHILAFERGAADKKTIKIFDRIGRPKFEAADTLNDKQLTQSIDRLIKLLGENSIAIDFLGDYEERTIYKFITEELFALEINDIRIPGMFTQFTYEDFHPNHKLDIESLAEEFLSQWIKRSLDHQSWELSDLFILPNGTTLPKSAVVDKIDKFSDLFTHFSLTDQSIQDVSFTLKGDSGLGHAEGFINYIATLEDGEKVEISGPFKLYMSLEVSWWSIFYFAFPGFTWV